MTIRERLERRRQIVDAGYTTPCWWWTGKLDQDGYGQIGLTTPEGMKFRRVHRVAYVEYKGPIPTECVADHLCRNRPCFNPDHLEMVVSKVNTLRGEGVTAQNVDKTRCPRGHLYTRTRPDGTRECQTCVREQARLASRRYQRKKRLPRGGDSHV